MLAEEPTGYLSWRWWKDRFPLQVRDEAFFRAIRSLRRMKRIHDDYTVERGPGPGPRGRSRYIAIAPVYEVRPYTRSRLKRRYRSSEVAFLPLRATDAPTAKTTPPRLALLEYQIGAKRMTTKHQMTPEERAYHHFFLEQWDSLSQAAHTLLEEAREAAYRRCMADWISYQDMEYEKARENMRLAATELTDHDCEGLTKLWRYALAAAASVDPHDNETVVARRAYPADLHSYYRMVSGMVEEVVRRKRFVENRKENSKSGNR